MTKKMINIGLPSKGRLKQETINIFKKNKLNIYSERGERDLFGYIKKIPNAKIIYLHARECIEQLSLGNIDIGFSGYDLFKESEVNVQNKILINKKYNYGNANLVLAIPDLWIDVQTLLDLDEVGDEFKRKKMCRTHLLSGRRTKTNPMWKGGHSFRWRNWFSTDIGIIWHRFPRDLTK